MKNMKQIFKRVNIEATAILYDDEKFYTAEVSNISRGGVFVKDLKALKEGRKVHVVVRSSSLEKPFKASGRVVRVQTHGQSGTAIQFTVLGPEEKALIQKCVEEIRTQGLLNNL